MRRKSPAKLLDGKFRRVSVKITRPGTTVQTRAGYFAVGTRTDGLNAFETPLLHILNAAEFPRSFPFRVAAIRFAPPKYGLAISGFTRRRTMSRRIENVTSGVHSIST